jgi:hypothetical protein
MNGAGRNRTEYENDMRVFGVILPRSKIALDEGIRGSREVLDGVKVER